MQRMLARLELVPRLTPAGRGPVELEETPKRLGAGATSGRAQKQWRTDSMIVTASLHLPPIDVICSLEHDRAK
jgi:hypothetical protein